VAELLKKNKLTEEEVKKADAELASLREKELPLRVALATLFLEKSVDDKEPDGLESDMVQPSVNPCPIRVRKQRDALVEWWLVSRYGQLTIENNVLTRKQIEALRHQGEYQCGAADQVYDALAVALGIEIRVFSLQGACWDRSCTNDADTRTGKHRVAVVLDPDAPHYNAAEPTKGCMPQQQATPRSEFASLLLVLFCFLLCISFPL